MLRFQGSLRPLHLPTVSEGLGNPLLPLGNPLLPPFQGLTCFLALLSL